MTSRHLMLLFVVAVAWQATAQTTIPADTSGNGMLQGNYYFRQVVYSTDGSGNIQRATAVYGTLTFDGKGGYSINGQKADSQTSGGQPAAYQASSLTYAIGSNGLGYLDNPLVTGEYVVGLVSKGVFVGSSTEGQLNDLMYAVSAGSTAATNATLNGNYWVAYMNLPAGDPTQGSDAIFKMNANGSGGISGTITANGYAGSASSASTQSIQSVSYSFASGVGTLTFPSTGTLINGSKILYVSPDGNFAIGGSASGYDMFAAVRATSGTLTNSSYNGLYYTAGLDEDFSTPGFAGLDTYYGSLSATGTGTIIRHQRLAYFLYSPYNQTFDDYYSMQSDGSFEDLAGFSGFQYAVGASGLGVVGIGEGPYPALFFGVQAPTFSGSGVYLNPTGVVNAASSSPFTTGVSPGELITLYGSNLAANTVVTPTLPFPTTLGGVQVSINGRPAPIYYVSPTQVSVIVPYATELTFAQITLTNNGTASNMVEVFGNDTMPGIFTLPPGGVGPGAILHPDYTVVSSSSPAKVGETVQVFLTGLGAVSPTITDGAAGPSSPFSTTVDTINVYMDGIQATVTYSGLAPGLAGLYQLNVTIPSGVSSGDVYLDIDTPDAYISQATIRIQ